MHHITHFYKILKIAKLPKNEDTFRSFEFLLKWYISEI